MKPHQNKSTVVKPSIKDDPNQKGTAIVIALFILALLGVFTALALTRSATEAAAVGNETAEGRTLYAAQASLEMMTRNFNKTFERKLAPSAIELQKVRDAAVPGLGGIAPGGRYTFSQELDQTSDSRTVVLGEGEFAGLYAAQDNWRLRTTATDQAGVQVQLTRNVLNNRIPIFQFGIFYNDDLELYRPPRFSFGGRVHTNRHFFISPGAEGVFFDSRVTAVGEIITQSWRNGNTSDKDNNQTFIMNAARANAQLLPAKGSVLNLASGGTNIFASDPDLPASQANTNWETDNNIFDGNLETKVKKLNLPLNIGGETAPPNILAEMVKRGKSLGDLHNENYPLNNGTVGAVTAANADDDVLKSERFANKTGIRISLADSKAKLPGCAATSTTPVATQCGIRLDGAIDGMGAEPAPLPIATPLPSPALSTLPSAINSRGYQPLPMRDVYNATTRPNGYRATRLNGTRFYNSDGNTPSQRQVWIKIETVRTNPTNNQIVTQDITEDILSLGVTEQAPALCPFVLNPANFSIMPGFYDYCTANASDSRSIIKLQRFSIPGARGDIGDLPGPAPGYITATSRLGGGFDNVVTRFTIAPYQVYQSVKALENSGTLPGLGISLTDLINRHLTDLCVRVATGTTASPVLIPPFSIGCSQNQNEVNLDPNAISTNINESLEYVGHVKPAVITASYPPLFVPTPYVVGVVPFPIQMYDAREGTWYDPTDSQLSSLYDTTKVKRAGTMSMVDIDVKNLRRFFEGAFNNAMPLNTIYATTVQSGTRGLHNTDIPEQNGWVLYVSDRRGDTDFDGEYDMEDVYNWNYTSGFNNNQLETGEDVNGNGRLDISFGTEAANYSENEVPAKAAIVDNKYYRRGVRLINGQTLPGKYDAATPSNTRGFTVSSENGVYVQGNYNATGVARTYPSSNTLYNEYLPFDTVNHIPASIVADSVTILSNAWDDTKAFASPYSQTQRVASQTTMRFALIAGDTIASKQANPHQGGISPRMNGGVHNFKRYLETWSGTNFNFCGSLINLYNSENNNGSFKCCDSIYNPPNRNWVFDSTFLDPARLPPGTPFFQYVQTTGFQRTNN